VVVVDDHRTFVDLLQFALEAEAGFSCVGAAYDLGAGLALVDSLRPDLVVMDYEFTGESRDGVVATATITARHPGTHVVVLTGHADANLVRRAAAAGASSLMPKDGSLSELLAALQVTGQAGLLVHPGLLRAGDGHGEETATSNPLSPRERDVLAMLAMGLGATAISTHLGISTNTCRGYIKSLLWKLDAHSQLEAVAIARRQGLVAGP
jgi:DNA-binding NarL/FixJ family response regulator